MQFQNEISISASAEKVFSIYTDVSGWSSWDPEVRASSIVGPFQTGALGTLKPTKGPEAKIAITDVVSNIHLPWKAGCLCASFALSTS
jgi:hypothetical protein